MLIQVSKREYIVSENITLAKRHVTDNGELGKLTINLSDGTQLDFIDSHADKIEAWLSKNSVSL